MENKKDYVEITHYGTILHDIEMNDIDFDYFIDIVIKERCVDDNDL